MFATSALVRSAPQIRAATRQMSAISGPPQTRISFPEKIAHGVFIGVGILAVPAWVLVHIRKYRGVA